MAVVLLQTTGWRAGSLLGPRELGVQFGEVSRLAVIFRKRKVEDGKDKGHDWGTHGLGERALACTPGGWKQISSATGSQSNCRLRGSPLGASVSSPVNLIQNDF